MPLHFSVFSVETFSYQVIQTERLGYVSTEATETQRRVERIKKIY